MSERWTPTPVPLGDGRHDIGDDARAAIVERLREDYRLCAPYLSDAQAQQLAMVSAASVRALVHELGVLREMSAAMVVIQAGDVVDLDGFALRPVLAESVRVLQGNDGVRAVYKCVWRRQDDR